MPIAFDATGNGGTSSATSLTWSHTCTGSNRILFVAPQGLVSGTDNITSMTYAGAAMTKIAQVQIPTDRLLTLWYLIAPATGANNVVINFTGNFMTGLSSSYTGASQTGVPDASNTGSTTGTSLTVAVTTVANNCWLVGNLGNSSSTAVAGTNTFGRLIPPGQGNGFFDSNAAQTPAGSHSLQTTFGSTVPLGGVVASIAPFVISTINSGFFFAVDR